MSHSRKSIWAAARSNSLITPHLSMAELLGAPLDNPLFMSKRPEDTRQVSPYPVSDGYKGHLYELRYDSPEYRPFAGDFATFMYYHFGDKPISTLHSDALFGFLFSSNILKGEITFPLSENRIDNIISNLSMALIVFITKNSMQKGGINQMLNLLEELPEDRKTNKYLKFLQIMLPKILYKIISLQPDFPKSAATTDTSIIIPPEINKEIFAWEAMVADGASIEASDIVKSDYQAASSK